MELENLYCIYCKRELKRIKNRKNQWHTKCHKAIYGKTSDILFQGEFIFKKDYNLLDALDKEIKERFKNYKLIKLFEPIRMFENFAYIIKNKSVIGLDLKFQVETPIFNFSHLEILYISRFREINSEISKVKKLKQLVIKHCPLRNLPDSIGRLSDLELLDISGITELKTLPETIGKLKKLKTFKLAPINERIKIQELPDCLSNLTELEFFYISGTNIERLPDGFGNLRNLQELYILSRSIGELPSLSKFQKLRIIECQAKLTRLPDDFPDLNSLEDLKLYNNMITELPDLSKLSNLRKLEIYNTSLHKLVDSVCSLKSLKILNVHNNPLEFLPENLSDLENLETIDVSKTKIKVLPDNFSFKELKGLNIAQTLITKIPEGAFLPKLEMLRINCYIPGISKFSSLKQLFIMNTIPGQVLDTFPDEIFTLHNLTSLDIGEATFTTILDKFDNLPKLSNLYIHKTNIKNYEDLPESLRDKLSIRRIVIYVHPDFVFNGEKNLINIRVKF